MLLFRQKPVTIEAVQWTGANTDEVREFVGRGQGSVIEITDPNIVGGRGLHLVAPGCIATPRDWIVRKGSALPTVISEADFAATYEPLVNIHLHLDTALRSVAEKMSADLKRQMKVGGR